jgi:hypothetical protein
VIENRHIRSVVKTRATIEGAGVHLYRLIGFGRPEPYDSFLVLDESMSNPGQLQARCGTV